MGITHNHAYNYNDELQQIWIDIDVHTVKHYNADTTVFTFQRFPHIFRVGVARKTDAVATFLDISLVLCR